MIRRMKLSNECTMILSRLPDFMQPIPTLQELLQAHLISFMGNGLLI